MENREIRDLVVSAVALAFIFSIAWFRTMSELIFLVPIALFGVSVAFLFHELAHRFVARRFGCYSEYRMWVSGLKLALGLVIVTKIIGFPILFAAPGAVMIYPRMDLWGRQRYVTRKENGLISLAGPGMNILLAGLCFLGLYYVGQGLWHEILDHALQINIFIALFNLLPIPPLDGLKILTWNKFVWGTVFLTVLGLYLFL